MKRIAAGAFLAGLLVCAGCFTSAPPPVLEPEPTAALEPAARPVTPDQVNAKNAHEKARELGEEIERETSRLAFKTPY